MSAVAEAPRKKAAHFLLVPELVDSPPNEAIVTALMEAGYDVDIYAPNHAPDVSRYGPGTRGFEVAYGVRWLTRCGISPKWRRYSVFSATAEDPFLIVGVLACLWRRPLFLLVDEIKTGTYSGDASSFRKRIYRWAMCRARFCIVNDESRVKLLQEYAGIRRRERTMVYPGCYRQPPEPADRRTTRESWGIPEDGIVVGISGGFNETAGAEWLLESFTNRPWMYLAIQPVGLSKFSRILLSRIRGSERIYLETRRLPWEEAWRTAAAMDIGIAIYLNEAPQFQNMGVSSNRLCMFLAMGVPVVVSRQPSFEFVEKYDCGVMVQNQSEFDEAVDHIAASREAMARNALRCTREYIDASGKYHVLRQRIGELGRSDYRLE